MSDLNNIEAVVPCPNNPSKFFNPNVAYILDPCKDYGQLPSGVENKSDAPIQLNGDIGIPPSSKEGLNTSENKINPIKIAFNNVIPFTALYGFYSMKSAPNYQKGERGFTIGVTAGAFLLSYLFIANPFGDVPLKNKKKSAFASSVGFLGLFYAISRGALKLNTKNSALASFASLIAHLLYLSQTRPELFKRDPTQKEIDEYHRSHGPVQTSRK